MRQIINAKVFADITSGKLTPAELQKKYPFSEVVAVSTKYPEGLVVIADEPRENAKSPFQNVAASAQINDLEANA